MYRQNYTMLNAGQIVRKGLKGCKTTRSVSSFAQKHNVPWVWYRPARNQKIMLVDWPQFRQTWREFKVSAPAPSQYKPRRKTQSAKPAGPSKTRACATTNRSYGTPRRKQATTFKSNIRTTTRRTRRAA